MKIEQEEYTAFKQILKDFAEIEYLPPHNYIAYISGVFTKVKDPEDPLDIIPLRKNPNSNVYYGSEYYNMAYKLKGLDANQINEIQSQLLSSILKSWEGPTQLELMSETVALIQEYTSDDARFGSVFKTVFDTYIDGFKEGLISEQEVKTAWTSFMAQHGSNHNLKNQLIDIAQNVGPVMSNTFSWWNDITFKYISPDSIINQKQSLAFEALGLTKEEQLKASIVGYNKDKSEQSLDFSI